MKKFFIDQINRKIIGHPEIIRKVQAELKGFNEANS